MGRAVLLASLVATTACRPAPAPPAVPPNVLLVVIDTLRADRLGVYGNTRGLTPFLDRLAASGTVVRRARVQVPWTNPSVASILTSRYASQHGVVDFPSVLPAAELTLAEVLEAEGYETGGFSANGLIGESLGFAQGFDHFEAHLLTKGEEPKYLRIPRRAHRMAEDVLAWLDGVRRDGAAPAPVFLYLQLMEPHPPYAPPAETLERIRGSRPPVDLQQVNRMMFAGTTAPVDAAQLEEIVDAYDASVLAVDEALERLFAALAARGFFEHAVVVVTADHGEELQEHGARGHGRALFDESLHVPLIVLVTNGPHAEFVDHLVSSVDIAPTILELAGVRVPARFEGSSFASDVRSGTWRRLRRAFERVTGRPAKPTTYSELLRPPGEATPSDTAHQRAVVVDDLKIIRWRDGTERYYDLRVDPGEQAPNIVEDPERARLETVLAEAEARAERDPSAPETLTPERHLRDELKALGYVQ